MKNVKISAIVPCFNNKDELLKTLLSIKQVKNNYCCIEIIIIDGSKEKLIKEHDISECIKRLNGKEIKTKYIHGKDSGPYDAMNKGLKNVGDDVTWLWFMNSGDEALRMPRRDLLISQTSTIIGCWYGTLDREKLIVPDKNRGLSMTNKSNIGHGICHQAMLFRSSKYRIKEYNWKRYRYAAELDYYIDSILENDYMIDKTFMCLYDNSKGLSQSKEIKHLVEQYLIYKKRGLEYSKYMKLKCFAKARIKNYVKKLRKMLPKLHKSI